MKIEFKSISFKVGDCTFSVIEFDKDQFFEFTGLKDHQQRYDYMLDKIVSIEGLSDSEGNKITPEILKTLRVPFSFVALASQSYMNEMYSALTARIQEQKGEQEKNDDSPTA